MNRFCLFTIFILLFALSRKAASQNSQTVTSGSPTTAINFAGTGCAYNWVNSNTSIGLAAAGAGDIPSFIAVNNGTRPVTAIIKVTPVPAGFAYVTCFNDTTASVISTANDSVIAIIPVGGAPFAVATSPDRSRAYIGSLANQTVSVINTSTNTVIAVIKVDVNPIGIVVSPDGGKVYVATEGLGSVTVIDAATNSIIAQVQEGPPYGLAISTDGSRLYASNLNSGPGPGTVSVINTSTLSTVAAIPVGLYPGGIAISPDGSRLYATSITNLTDVSSIVSVIDTKTNKVIATVPVSPSADGVAVGADGSRVYVSCGGSTGLDGGIAVINTTTNKVMATLAIPGISEGLTVSPDGSRLYAGDDVGEDELVISTATNAIIDKIPMGPNADPNSFGNFVTGGSGCSSMPQTFTITVNPTGYTGTNGPLVVPNAFTPNGDGINDTWNIKDLNTYPNCTVQIYNRFGENVFSSTGYGTPWDGTCKRGALPTGTYYYIIDLKDDSKPLSGFVTIIR